MNWLARLKNEKASGAHATKATKPGFVGFVAYPHGPFQKSEAIAGACVTDAETGAKNQNAPSVDATKATKPGFVGFVAPTPGVSQKINAEEAKTAPLTASEESAIRAWLRSIEETDLEIISEVLDCCQRDEDVRRYFLSRAMEQPAVKPELAPERN
jgi:hypothetical protein